MNLKVGKWLQKEDSKEEDIQSLKETTTKSSFKFFNWTISFTKNIIQVAFIIFVIANLFIFSLIGYHYFNTGELIYLDIVVQEVYAMFVSVIGGYIIKAATENTFKIVGSVLSKWLDLKYNYTETDDSVLFDPYNSMISGTGEPIRRDPEDLDNFDPSNPEYKDLSSAEENGENV